MRCLLGIYLNFCTLRRTRSVQNTSFIAHIFEFVYDQRKMSPVTALSMAYIFDINCEFSKSIRWFGSPATFHNRNLYLIYLNFFKPKSGCPAPSAYCNAHILRIYWVRVIVIYSNCETLKIIPLPFLSAD
jgi:hypothetical protein